MCRIRSIRRTRASPVCAEHERLPSIARAECARPLGPFVLRLLPPPSKRRAIGWRHREPSCSSCSTPRSTGRRSARRESTLRDLARQLNSPELSLTAFGYGLMWYDTQREMDLSVELFALTMLVVMGVALWAVYRRTLRRAPHPRAARVHGRLGPWHRLAPWNRDQPGDPSHPRAAHRPRGRLCGPPRPSDTAGCGGRAPTPAARLSPPSSGSAGSSFVATVTNGLSFLSFGGSQIASSKTSAR